MKWFNISLFFVGVFGFSYLNEHELGLNDGEEAYTSGRKYHQLELDEWDSAGLYG